MPLMNPRNVIGFYVASAAVLKLFPLGFAPRVSLTHSGISLHKPKAMNCSSNRYMGSPPLLSPAPSGAAPAFSVGRGRGGGSGGRGAFRGGRGRGRRPPHCQLCRLNGHFASAFP